MEIDKEQFIKVVCKVCKRLISGMPDWGLIHFKTCRECNDGTDKWKDALGHTRAVRILPLSS